MARTLLIVCALTVVVDFGRADASVITYSSRTAFETAAGAVTVQNFNSYADTPNAFEGVSFDFGDFSAINGVNAARGGDIENPSTVNGTTGLIGSLSVSGITFKFTFDHPIFAIGFDADNLADQRIDSIDFNNSAGNSAGAHDAVDQIRFWGFISDTPFTTMTIRQTGFTAGGTATDGFRIDNVTYTAVPEADALMLIGFVGLCATVLAGVRGAQRSLARDLRTT